MFYQLRNSLAELQNHEMETDARLQALPGTRPKRKASAFDDEIQPIPLKETYKIQTNWNYACPGELTGLSWKERLVEGVMKARDGVFWTVPKVTAGFAHVEWQGTEDAEKMCFAEDGVPISPTTFPLPSQMTAVELERHEEYERWETANFPVYDEDSVTAFFPGLVVLYGTRMIP